MVNHLRDWQSQSVQARKDLLLAGPLFLKKILIFF